MNGATTLCIVEGYATGATIHEGTGYPVVVALNTGNLEPVARPLRKRFPNLRLIFCADDDPTTAGNPRLAKVTEAARSVDGLLGFPTPARTGPRARTTSTTWRRPVASRP